MPLKPRDTRTAIRSGGLDGAALATLREIRRTKIHAAYEEAARDPEFVEEMNEITAAFDVTLLDGLEEETTEAKELTRRKRR